MVSIQLTRAFLWTIGRLCGRKNSESYPVRRYSTGGAPNTFSALIQNYYSQETSPHHAIHLTVDTGEQSEELGIKAYLG